METESNQFMKAYTINEVSQAIDVPPGTIRQWEKSLDGLLHIPRDERGSRYYTEFEINTLNTIKAMRDKGLNFEVIKDILGQSETPPPAPMPVASMPVMSQSEAIQSIHNLQTIVQDLSARMETLVANNVRNEIAKVNDTVTTAIIEQLAKSEAARKDAERALAEKAKQEQLDLVIFRNKVEGELELEALAKWREKPESERMVKLSWFRTAEDLDKRYLFVREYINQHFASRFERAWNSRT